MKYFRHILQAASACLVASVLFSCSKDDVNGPEYVLRDVSVKVSVASGNVPVKFQKGDQIEVLYYRANANTLGSNTLTTEDGTTFEESAYMENASKYWFVSPSSGLNYASASKIYASVPSVQTLEDGGIAASSALAVGESTQLEGTVTLTPAVAFVRFSVAGEIAGQVSNVTISSESGYLAGDVAITNPGSRPQTAVDLDRGFVTPSRSVILRGTVDPGAVYYAAVAPGSYPEGLSVSLSDATGNGTTFDISTAFDLGSGDVADLGTLQLGGEFEKNLYLTRVLKATRGAKPTVLVFAPEGFTEGSGPSTREDYENACYSALDLMFTMEPYKSLRDYFTVYIAWKASETAEVGGTFNTQLGLDYDGYWGMKVEDRKVTHAWAKALIPEWRDDVTSQDDGGIFLVVNGRDRYGSVCWWETEGRFIAIINYSPDYIYWSGHTQPGQEVFWFGGSGYYVRQDDGSDVYHTMTDDEYQALGLAHLWTGSTSWCYLGDWRNVLLHEGLGHGFGRLQDEYWSGYDEVYSGTGIRDGQNLAVPRGLNLSDSITDYPWKKFKEIVDAEYLSRDARYGRMGLWQGGFVRYSRGIWRSEIIDCLKDERPYFATWSRAVIYQRVMKTSGDKPNFDVINNEADIREFLDFDLANNGAYDPIRGE